MLRDRRGDFVRARADRQFRRELDTEGKGLGFGEGGHGKRLEIPGRPGNDNPSMRAPAQLPDETLFRVLRLARFNGTSVLVIAGFFSLVSATAKDVPGALVGVFVAGAGALELHGAGFLRRGDERGVSWLVGSQLYLLVVVLAYVAFKLLHLDIEQLRPLLTADQRETIKLAGLAEDEFLRLTSTIMAVTFGFVTFVYQGAMAYYYHKRRSAIATALADESDAA